ncbi:hypothetical protein PQX77_021149 [Marasmius sp. AFHP31]|nr:hypothetical protein PQX77_021149 [Marasmius sp. AFHP31]
MPVKRRQGLSRKVKKAYGSSGTGMGVTTTRVNIAKTQHELQLDRDRLQAMFVSLNFPGRSHFEENNNDIPFYDGNEDYEDDDDFPMASAPPPGQEGLDHSHSGQAIFEDVVSQLLSHSNRRADDRTRRDRTEKQNQSWARQHDALVDAYLQYKEFGPQQGQRHDIIQSIQAVSLDRYTYVDYPHFQDSASINESLVFHGYLGGSPEQPTVAFEIKTLAIYRQLHRVCPGLSIDAFSRALQHIHGIPRHSHLEDQLRVAYDQYLAMERDIDDQCKRFLGRDSDTYATQNICAPCTYELEEEEPLHPRILLSIDGNNSLKMVDSEHKHGEARTDTRKIPDPRWLEADDVDVFKDEVQNAQKKLKRKGAQDPSTAPQADTDEIAWLNVNETQDLKSCVNTCVERWRAAAPEDQKRMFAFFSVTGIFVAVCRHGHLYLMCDMRKSGELMKYPLSIVHKILERYGEDLGIGYDIMCAFWKTMMRSDKLGPKITGMRLRGVVPAFHGHAHNRKCQLYWHPMYIPGIGLTDFEECERFFSLSNRLAITTHLATAFHRRQIILEHVNFHSDDKNATFGNFVFNQYREALKRLGGLVPLFHKHCKDLNMSPEACEQLLDDERKHFLRDMTEEDNVAVSLDYAELLTKLWNARYLLLYYVGELTNPCRSDADQALAKFNAMNRGEGNFSLQEKSRIRSKKNTTFQRWSALKEEVCNFEIDSGIAERWAPDGEEYRDALMGMSGRRYRRALEKLERLVVQRLLELTKLNMSGVGYKQRMKISQALTARAEAIKKAIAEYNHAADLLSPPRDHITWADIVQMVSLADFDLLKHTELDLAQLTWARDEYREVMHEHYQILRAREEIQRLNVEIKWKVTFMIDDYADHLWAERRATVAGDSALATELARRWEIQSRFDAHIARRLLDTSQLKGFTGDLTPGERIGRNLQITDQIPLPTWATSVLGLQRVQASSTLYQQSNDIASHGGDNTEDPSEEESSDSDSGDQEDRADRLIALFSGWSV